ncbi:MAG: hypothetical protein JXA35_10775 [Deltaproteobacteria bacterium]|nr:hypothetical protein [Deltaproteobacteria bacterium]
MGNTGIVSCNPADTDCEITITPYTEEGVPLTPATDIISGKDRYFGLVDGDIDLPV